MSDIVLMSNMNSQQHILRRSEFGGRETSEDITKGDDMVVDGETRINLNTGLNNAKEEVTKNSDVSTTKNVNVINEVLLKIQEMTNELQSSNNINSSITERSGNTEYVVEILNDRDIDGEQTEIEIMPFQETNKIPTKEETLAQNENVSITVAENEDQTLIECTEVNMSQDSFEYIEEINATGLERVARNDNSVRNDDSNEIISLDNNDIETSTPHHDFEQYDNAGNIINNESILENTENNQDILGEFFIVRTYEEVLKQIQEYSEKTSCRFVRQGRSKDFAVTKPPVLSLKGHAVYYTHKKFFNKYMRFDGVPHVTTGYWSLACQYGKSSNPYKRKEGVTPKKRATSSIKLNCPVTIFVKQFVKFPQFKIAEETESRKRTAAQKLKKIMQEDQSNVVMEFYYAGRLPDVSEHRFHDLSVTVPRRGEEINAELITKIQKLYLQNYSSIEIVKEIEQYVKTEMFYNQPPPQPDNRHFFPGKRDVRNVIAKVRLMNMILKDDEAKIQKFIQERESLGDSVYFEIFNTDSANNVDYDTGTETEDDENTQCEVLGKRKNKLKKKGQYRVKLKPFLLCFQSSKQQSVFRRYNDCVLFFTKVMPCKPIPYSIYLLAVQTNVDFQIVGVFIVSNYNVSIALQKALAVFKEWNRYWKPKYFMIDFHQEITEVIELVYTDTDYYFNFDSCYDSWMEFLNTPSNELLENKSEVIDYLSRMAFALSSESLAEAAEFFEQSLVWKESVKLRSWVQDKWINVSRRWMSSYLPEDFIVMNHSCATLSQCKQPFLRHLETASYQSGLINLLKKLSLDILEEQYTQYVSKNIDLNVTSTSFIKENDIPQCCQGIPSISIPYLLPIAKLAMETEFTISKDMSGNFIVSPDNPIINPVNVNLWGSHESNYIECSGNSVNSNENVLTADNKNETQSCNTESLNAVDHIIEAVEQIIEINKVEMNESVDHTKIANGECVIVEENTFSNQDFLKQDRNKNLETNVKSNFIHSTDSAFLNCTTNPNEITIRKELTEMKQDSVQNKNVYCLSSKLYEFGRIESHSSVEQGEFLISFGDVLNFPVCTCTHWQKYKLPCVHMFTIFHNLQGWSYEMLSPLYRSNNMLNLDTSVVCRTKPVTSTSTQKDDGKKPDGVKIVTITPVKNGSVKITEQNKEKFFIKSSLVNVTGPVVEQCERMLNSISFLSTLFKNEKLAENLERELLDLSVELKTKLIKDQMKKEKLFDNNGDCSPGLLKNELPSSSSIDLTLKRKPKLDDDYLNNMDRPVYVKRPKLPSSLALGTSLTPNDKNSLIIMDTSLPIPLTLSL